MTDKTDKTILTHEAEIQAWLVAHGFALSDKLNLFQKVESNGDRIYWDFREHPKGWCYGWKKTDDRDFSEEEIKRLSDYIAFREEFTPSQPVGIAAPAPPAPSTPAPASPASAEKPKRTPKATPPAPGIGAIVQQPAAPTVSEAKEGQLVLHEDEAYTIMNIKDDAQVLAEMQGKYLDEMVYSFDVKEGQGKRTVTGLSWVGVKETVRTAGNIVIEQVDIQETPERFRILAKGHDVAHNVTLFGIAEQSKKIVRNGQAVDDLHALSKCLSRAQRNALRSLIPEVAIKNTIDTYLQKKSKGKAA